MQFLHQYSYLGLFFIIFIEEAGVPLPVPGDIFIAAQAGVPNSNYLYTIAAVVLATIFGSSILFLLARKFGPVLIQKFGKYFRFTDDKQKKVEGWLTKHGGKAIVVGRLIPGLRIITTIVAGSFEISYKTFIIYTAIAAFIWANIYFFIGKFAGDLFVKAAQQFNRPIPMP